MAQADTRIDSESTVLISMVVQVDQPRADVFAPHIYLANLVGYDEPIAHPDNRSAFDRNVQHLVDALRGI
jgi:hypothetical protein